jgi:hypothetical protein
MTVSTAFIECGKMKRGERIMALLIFSNNF